jgi:hypothetical protein
MPIQNLRFNILTLYYHVLNKSFHFSSVSTYILFHNYYLVLGNVKNNIMMQFCFNFFFFFIY